MNFNKNLRLPRNDLLSPNFGTLFTETLQSLLNNCY